MEIGCVRSEVMYKPRSVCWIRVVQVTTCKTKYTNKECASYPWWTSWKFSCGTEVVSWGDPQPPDTRPTAVFCRGSATAKSLIIPKKRRQIAAANLERALQSQDMTSVMWQEIILQHARKNVWLRFGPHNRLSGQPRTTFCSQLTSYILEHNGQFWSSKRITNSHKSTKIFTVL
jgi:hypothetical protein